MSRNSSEPRRLVRYARTIGADVAPGEARIADGRLAITAHNSVSPSFAVDTAAITAAERALAGLARLTQTTMVTAAAFLTADRSGGPVRRARTETLAALDSSIVGIRFDGDGVPDAAGVIGLLHERSGHRSYGPLTVDGRGRVLVGAEGSTSFRGPTWEDGELLVEAEVDGFAGARVDAGGTAELGPATATGTLGAMIGAEGRAGANAAIGRDGVTVGVGGEAFVGAKVEGEVAARIASAEASAACHAAAGVGGSAHAEAELTWDEISVSAGWGVSWLLGAGCTTSFSFSPSETFDMAKRGGEWFVETTGNLAGGAYDFATDVGGSIVDVGRPMWDLATGWIE